LEHHVVFGQGQLLKEAFVSQAGAGAAGVSRFCPSLVVWCCVVLNGVWCYCIRQ
jgi:hypothetical protein